MFNVGSRRKGGEGVEIVRMHEQNPDINFRHWGVKFMSARKDKFTNVEGFSLPTRPKGSEDAQGQ